MPQRIRIRHSLAVWAALWRVRAQHELQYRANFAINVLQVVIDLTIGLITIQLVFNNVEALNGWTRPELLVVLGTYTILDAFIRAVVLPNMFALVQDVQEGTFDSVLAMPVDEQLVISTRQLSVWDLAGVVVGSTVTVFGAQRLADIGVEHIAGYVALLGTAFAIVYSFFLAVTSVTFRFIDLRDLLFRLFQASSYSGRWPLGIYPDWLRIALTAIVPVGLAVTIPSTALVGRLTMTGLVLAAAATATALIASRLILRRSLRQYSGASA